MSEPRLRLLAALMAATIAACGVVPSAEPPPPATDVPTATASVAASPTPPPAAETAGTPAASAAPTLSLDWILQAPSAETPFEIPLVLRHVAASSAVFQYQLAEPVDSQLLLWRATDRGELRQLSVPAGGGLVTVEGLEPAVSYQAAVVIPGTVATRPVVLGEAWGPVEFTTRAAEGDALRIAVFGDSGFGGPLTRALATQMADEGVDLALHTGDIAYRLHEDPDPPTGFLTKYYQNLAPLLLTAPLYPVPGNHEYDLATRWQGRPYYFQAFPSVPHPDFEVPAASDGSWYAFQLGDVQFLMLSSQAIFGQAGFQMQTAWLAQRIEDPAYRYSVAVFHVPPHNAGRHQGDSRILRSRWGDLLASPRVPLVLSGHDHNYQRFEMDGTTYLVTGGASRSLYTVADAHSNLKAASSRSHYVILTLGQDQAEVRAIDEDGRVFDQAIRELPSP